MGIKPEFAPLARFYTQESSLLTEIKAKVDAIFATKFIPGEVKEGCEAIKAATEQLNLSEFGEFNELKKALMDATELKGKGFFMPLRILLTGVPHGPELSELYPLIKPYLKEILR